MLNVIDCYNIYIQKSYSYYFVYCAYFGSFNFNVAPLLVVGYVCNFNGMLPTLMELRRKGELMWILLCSV